MAHPGQELTDPVTGARLRFLETAGSSNGSVVALELDAEKGWSAGPLHVHPRQTESLRVLDGRFRARVARSQRDVGPAEAVEVAPNELHTIRLLSEKGSLRVEFTPALRTDELFETMFAAGFPRRPPAVVPGALRAFVESRGFREEIRYRWPRRLTAAFASGLAAAALVALARRR